MWEDYINRTYIKHARIIMLCSFILLFLTQIISVLNSEHESLVLKQVVILSRHNVRTPLSKTLYQISPKPWPKWKEKFGYLTSKGQLLEGYMGEYFSSWLAKEGMLSNECPSKDDFYVYANTKQRTMASAKSFVNKAFPKCNITIHHANESDPIFNPYIHNSSTEFISEAISLMNQHIKALHLNYSYEMLENILDYEKSEICIKNHQCNLILDPNKVFVKTGTKPNISGPLQISKSAIDSFLMENYEGFDENNVAWGELETDNKWQTIMEISKSYHNIIFNSSVIAADIARPMIEYLSKIFINETPNVTLVMGHDSNIYTVLAALGFKPYSFDNQFEMVPVGGKIVFQKWANGKKELLKVYYVYQGTKQMRKGIKLTLSNPPTTHHLELDNCPVDENGFCLWSDFINILNKF